MIIKIAIVEDEKASAQTIENYIKTYEEESGEKFEVRYFADGDEIVANYTPVFHIIFLDIRMKNLNGMATAEFIRKLDKEVNLIFITNMAQYAIKGYSVYALDFLLKPVSYFAFSELLKKTVEVVKKKMQDNFLLLRTDIGTIKMNLSEIIFIESFRNNMVVHTLDKDYTLYSTMSELESMLSNNNFFRCSKSYLINMAFVDAVKDNNAIIGKQSIRIGRAKKGLFMEALTDYVGAMSR